MKKRLFVLYTMFLLSYCAFSQGVGIGTAKPDSSAALDVTSKTKGVLVPRMKTSGILAVILPAKGLLVYDSSTNQMKVNVGGPATPNWQPVGGTSGTGSSTAWSLTGNSGINPTTQFMGTNDKQPLRFRVNN